MSAQNAEQCKAIKMKINAWEAFGLFLFFIISYYGAFVFGTWWQQGTQGAAINYYFPNGKSITILQQETFAKDYENVCKNFGFSKVFIGCDGSYATCGGD